MKLKFNSDAWYNGVLLYEAGKTYEVKEELGFARRWINRGAEEVIDCPVVKAPAHKVEQDPIPETEVGKELEVEQAPETVETTFVAASKKATKKKSEII